MRLLCDHYCYFYYNYFLRNEESVTENASDFNEQVNCNYERIKLTCAKLILNSIHMNKLNLIMNVLN